MDTPPKKIRLHPKLFKAKKTWHRKMQLLRGDPRGLDNKDMTEQSCDLGPTTLPQYHTPTLT